MIRVTRSVPVQCSRGDSPALHNITDRSFFVINVILVINIILLVIVINVILLVSVTNVILVININ